MGSATTITINDRETTPVAHAFVPRYKGDTANNGDNGSFTFRRAAAIPEGEESLIIRWRRGTDGKYRARITLAVPVVVTETINSVSRYSVDRVAFADVNFTFDGSSSLQERKNIVGLIANALAASQTLVDSTLTGLEGIW